MKLLIIFIALSVILIFKKRRSELKGENDYLNRNFQDITDLYTIKYKTHYKVSTEIKLTQQEQEIFNIMKSEEFNQYNFCVTGGWVRDKILGEPPSDMDITVDAYTMENLANIIEKMFVIIQKNQSNKEKINNETDEENNFLQTPNDSIPITGNQNDLINPPASAAPLDPVMFRRPFKIKNYGKMTFTIYGMDIDLEVLAKERTVTPVPGFVPTGDVIDDAITRDLKINAVFYDIRKNKIIDPLKGISDMEKGIIETPQGEKTFTDDYLRVFSIIKTSSKLSMKMSDSISNLIKNNIISIKQFMLIEKEEITNVKLRRIILGDYSLKAFKIMYDFNLYDPCIPENYYDKFNSNQTLYSTEIFNFISISEMLIKLNHLNINAFDQNEKYMLYMDSFRLEFENFGNYEKLIYSFKNQTPITEKLNPRDYLLTISKLYCERVDCTSSILKVVYLDEIKYIINNLKINVIN